MSWLAFIAQKVLEVTALAKVLAGQNDEAFFSANAAAQASRRSSPRVTNEEVQKAASSLRGSDHRRAILGCTSWSLNVQRTRIMIDIAMLAMQGAFVNSSNHWSSICLHGQLSMVLLILLYHLAEVSMVYCVLSWRIRNLRVCVK